MTMTPRIKKPDNAYGVYSINGNKPYFETYLEAEIWGTNNFSGGIGSIDYLTWCEGCQDFTPKFYVNGQWVSDCCVCDADYIARWQTEREKLAAWNGAK